MLPSPIKGRGECLINFSKRHGNSYRFLCSSGSSYLSRVTLGPLVEIGSDFGENTDCIDPEPELRNLREHLGRKENVDKELERLRERLRKEEELRAEHSRQFKEYLDEVSTARAVFILYCLDCCSGHTIHDARCMTLPR